MQRSKVVIHMYVSIDGKIDGPHGSGVSSAYYSDELFRLSNADGNGRTTIQMYAAGGHPDLTPYAKTTVPLTSWLPDVHAKTWSVAFDRQGTCGWERNYFAYNGHDMHAIEVVTRQASPAYLAYLRTLNIPYIVSGDTDFDLPAVLQTLKTHFGIDTLAVCGGAVIDGAFLKAHLVDQISLVVAPHVDGNANAKAAFDTLGTYVTDTFAFSGARPLADGGVHLTFDRQA